MTSSDRSGYPIFDFDPRKIPAEYLAAIGFVTACSAQTENIVEMLIAGLADTDTARGAAITTHMSAPLRDGVARSLAQLSSLPEQALDDLDELLDNINATFARRNTYVHNLWATDELSDRVFYLRTRAKAEFSMDSVDVSLEVLNEDALKIYYAGMALLGFIRQWELIPAAPSVPSNFRDRGKSARKKKRKKG